MEIHNEIVNVLRDTAASKKILCNWPLEFKCGCTNTEDDPCSGRPKSATTLNTAPALHKVFSYQVRGLKYDTHAHMRYLRSCLLYTSRCV